MSLQPEAFSCCVLDEDRDEVTYARIVQTVVLFANDSRDVFPVECGKSCREPFDHVDGVVPFTFTCSTHTGIVGPHPLAPQDIARRTLSLGPWPPHPVADDRPLPVRGRRRASGVSADVPARRGRSHRRGRETPPTIDLAQARSPRGRGPIEDRPGGRRWPPGEPADSVTRPEADPPSRSSPSS